LWFLVAPPARGDTLGVVRRAIVLVCLAASAALAACGGGEAAQVDVTPAPMTELRFAIVGDTRPTNEDDTANYPTAIVTRIWDDVNGELPEPAFAISTGDYMYASPVHGEQDAQLDLYLGARAHYDQPVYAAMGNHECTGSTTSNCGDGAADGVTANSTAFLDRMVRPLGANRPWYVVHLAAADGTWTAKLVVIAANAWSDEQAAWLDAALAAPTTYTFVVRHEPDYATSVDGVNKSGAIVAAHPLTLLVTGHVHTYAHYPDMREVIVGNGGAPLVSSIDYGYAIVFRRPDGALDFTEYDYATRAVIDHFAVSADGTPAN
jgi:hypothetical protein